MSPLLGGWTGEVHVRRVIGPRSEDERAHLFVKRVVGDIDLTHRLECTSGLPPNTSVVVEYRSEVTVVFVNPLSSDCERL